MCRLGFRSRSSTLRSSTSATIFAYLLIALAPLQPAIGAATQLQDGQSTKNAHSIKVVLEVTGHLLSKEPNQTDEEAQKHPLKAIGNLVYEERMEDLATRRSLRFYEQASADIEVDGRSESLALRDDRRWIRVSTESDRPALTSPEGGLMRHELELLEVPAASHLVAFLLPEKPVDVGDRWQTQNDHLARIFNLKGVSVNDVTSELKSLENNVAKIELSGQLVGSAQGVVTTLDVKAKYNYDLQRKQITWVAVAIRESRSIGLGTPGLEVTARLRMVVSPAREPQHLKPEQIAAIAQVDDTTASLLEYRPPGRSFLLLHDRHWHVLQEQSRLSVLRWVDQGQMVAQCNLLSLDPSPEGPSLQLTQFQQEIRRALGSSVTQMVDAREMDINPDVRALRIIVAGQVSEAPIQWIYYHLTHASGRRLSCVFTMSADEVERFGGEDLELAGSILFLDPGPDAEATAEVSTESAVQR